MTLVAKSNELRILEAAPAIDTLAYVTGDLIGPKLTLADAVKTAGGGGLIQSVFLADKAKQDAAIDLMFWSADPAGTTFADNDPLDIADADLAKLIGIAQITLYADFADNSVGFKLNLALPFSLEAGTSLFAAMVARAAATYAAADLTLRVGVLAA